MPFSRTEAGGSGGFWGGTYLLHLQLRLKTFWDHFVVSSGEWLLNRDSRPWQGFSFLAERENLAKRGSSGIEQEGSIQPATIGFPLPPYAFTVTIFCILLVFLFLTVESMHHAQLLSWLPELRLVLM